MKYELVISTKNFKTNEPQLVYPFADLEQARNTGKEMRKKYQTEYMFINISNNDGKLIKTEFVDFMPIRPSTSMSYGWNKPKLGQNKEPSFKWQESGRR